MRPATTRPLQALFDASHPIVQLLFPLDRKLAIWLPFAAIVGAVGFALAFVGLVLMRSKKPAAAPAPAAKAPAAKKSNSGKAGTKKE